MDRSYDFLITFNGRLRLCQLFKIKLPALLIVNQLLSLKIPYIYPFICLLKVFIPGKDSNSYCRACSCKYYSSE